MLVRLVQPSKALVPMEVTLSGMVMLVRLVQPQKAPSMEVTLSGMVMLSRLVQSEKAYSPIPVTIWLLIILGKITALGRLPP